MTLLHSSLPPLAARFALLLALLLPASYAQMTRAQRLADFQQLAAIYAKNYKPYEWKLQAFGYDMLDLGRWLPLVEASTDDLDFYNVCVHYVASLRDSHDEFILPSDFEAYLPLTADVYDGKVLIELIDRVTLPLARFPFRAGDEIVSVDGKPTAQWLDELEPYSANGMGNDSARRRLAALTMIDRYQGIYPYAPRIGDNATVEIRGADGQIASYSLPWQKSGTPLLSIGPVPSPHARLASSPPQPERFAQRGLSRVRAGEPSEDSIDNPWGIYLGPEPPRTVEPAPPYLQFLRDLQSSEPVGPPNTAVAGFGARNPVFNPPARFALRLGALSTDQFLSGTFPLGSDSIGFIRVPTMSPSNQTLAVTQFQNEMQFFNQNTRALVIDVMHNGGGSLCYTETLIRSLSPTPFRSVAYEIRATEYWVQVFSSFLTSAKLSRADQWVIDVYTAYLAEVEQARKELRGSTGDLPICGVGFQNVPPATAANGTILAYTKPIIVLTNEFTLSAAESFVGLLQDAGRITALGTRTTGGGGNPASYNAGIYSMGTTRATRTLVTRARPISTPGLPAGNHLENIGAYPDVWADYMTKDNLLTGGAPFVEAIMSNLSRIIAGNR